MPTVHLRIRGRVQGVGFRYFTLETAQALGVHGWVQNVPTGDVEAVGQGDQASLDAWVDRLRKGPSMARVDDIRLESENTESFDSFEIR